MDVIAQHCPVFILRRTLSSSVTDVKSAVKLVVKILKYKISWAQTISKVFYTYSAPSSISLAAMSEIILEYESDTLISAGISSSRDYDVLAMASLNTTLILIHPAGA